MTIAIVKIILYGGGNEANHLGHIVLPDAADYGLFGRQ